MDYPTASLFLARENRSVRPSNQSSIDWNAVNQNSVTFRPASQQAANIPSAVEIRFARIANELTARWKTDLIDPYMDSLLIDTRGGRQGFPADVQEDLMFLSGVLWHRQHSANKVEDFQTLDQFSFSAENERDMRRCGTTGAWVLI